MLEANYEFVKDWIPAHVATPLPVTELAQRLAGFAADFDAGRSWRFGIVSADEREIYGEVTLFFRTDTGRTALDSADRLEIGYWLHREVTGRGYATEAAREMMVLARELGDMSHVEIRCDPLNAPSAAVPRRLGFRLVTSDAPLSANVAGTADGMLWVYDLRMDR